MEIQNALIPKLHSAITVVSNFDPSIFTAFHSDSEEILGKYQMQRDNDSVVLVLDFDLPVFDELHQCDFPMNFELSFHFYKEKFRSLILSTDVHGGVVYPVFVGRPGSYITSEPAKVKKKCYSLYIGESKYLISDLWYDIIDFEARAFQESTVAKTKLGLAFTQQIIDIMGVK